jgi:hypothetical protein
MLLWRSLTREAVRKSFSVPSLSDFSCLLEGDKRFELINDPEAAQGTGDLEIVDSEEMGKLGFLGSQRVRLRSLSVKRDDDDEDSDDADDEESDDGDPLFDRALLSERRAPARSAKALKVNAVTSIPRTTGSGKASPAAKGKTALKKKTIVKASSAKRRK